MEENIDVSNLTIEETAQLSAELDVLEHEIDEGIKECEEILKMKGVK